MTRMATAPQSGWVRAELDGPGAGDWDLAVFDRASGRLVAGSSSFGADEVAEGLAVEGHRGCSCRPAACPAPVSARA